MPIRFACQKCGQRLNVMVNKAGLRARCPRCKEPLTIPTEPTAGGPEADVEWTSDASEAPGFSPVRRPVAPKTLPTDGRVRVPRYVIFTQGLLLAVVACGCFALGYHLGGARATAPAPDTPGPCTVSGNVVYQTSGGTRFPDEGAVILIVPQDSRPATDEKLDTEALKPVATATNSLAEMQQRVRQMGGAYARADVEGNFRVQLPHGGRYFALVVSHYGERPADAEPNKADLAQLGRYVTAAAELLADRRYRWTSEDVRKDVRWTIALE